jgi:hypothetical protein
VRPGVVPLLGTAVVVQPRRRAAGADTGEREELPSEPREQRMIQPHPLVLWAVGVVGVKLGQGVMAGLF